jgi:hypothetical protein
MEAAMDKNALTQKSVQASFPPSAQLNLISIRVNPGEHSEKNQINHKLVHNRPPPASHAASIHESKIRGVRY